MRRNEQPRPGRASKPAPRTTELRLEPLTKPQGRGGADPVEQALAAWRQQRPEPPEEPVIEF